MLKGPVRTLSISAALMMGVIFSSEVHGVTLDCTHMEEKQCGFLAKAIQKWNQTYSGDYYISTARDVGPVDSHTAMNSLLYAEIIRVAVGVESDSDWVHMLIRTVEGEENIRKWRNVWTRYLSRTLQNAQEIREVELEWEQHADNRDNGRDFTTSVFVSDFWPYIHGQVVSDITIASEENSCYRKEFSYLWGLIKGEIIADLVSVPVPTSSRGFVCKRVTEAWIELGEAHVESDDVVYEAEFCQFRYAWGYATPVADLRFKSDDFQFTVSGLGASGTGSGDCVALFRQ